MTEEERYESVSHCKWVDEVVRDAPWVLDAAFLEAHAIDFVAHDELPYPDATGAGEDAYEFVKRAGKFRATQRTEGISTSDLILRLIKDYNAYVLRNLRRGFSRHDMNVSYAQEKRLRVASWAREAAQAELRTLRTGLRERQSRVEKHLRFLWDTARDRRELRTVAASVLHAVKVRARPLPASAHGVVQPVHAARHGR